MKKVIVRIFNKEHKYKVGYTTYKVESQFAKEGNYNEKIAKYLSENLAQLQEEMSKDIIERNCTPLTARKED